LVFFYSKFGGPGKRGEPGEQMGGISGEGEAGIKNKKRGRK
jgi:hypothetical protein